MVLVIGDLYQGIAVFQLPITLQELNFVKIGVIQDVKEKMFGKLKLGHLCTFSLMIIHSLTYNVIQLHGYGIEIIFQDGVVNVHQILLGLDDFDKCLFYSFIIII